MMNNQETEYPPTISDYSELQNQQRMELVDEVKYAVTKLLDQTDAEGFTIQYERNETGLVIKVEEAEEAQSSREVNEYNDDVLLEPNRNFKVVLLRDDYGDKQFAITYRTRRKFGGIEQDTVETTVLDSKSLRYLRVGSVDGQWFVVNGNHKPYNPDKAVMKVLSKKIGYEIIHDIMSLLEKKEDKSRAEEVMRWSRVSSSLTDIAGLLLCVSALAACVKYLMA